MTTKTKATPKAKAYSLEATFNGETYTSKTDDLGEALLKMKPAQLHTEIYVTAKKGEEVSERRLSLTQGKRVFIDDIVRQVFIQNLLLN